MGTTKLRALLLVDIDQTNMKKADSPCTKKLLYILENKKFEHVIVVKQSKRNIWEDLDGHESVVLNANKNECIFDSGVGDYLKQHNIEEVDIVGFNPRTRVLDVAVEINKRGYTLKVLRDMCWDLGGYQSKDFEYVGDHVGWEHVYTVDTF